MLHIVKVFFIWHYEWLIMCVRPVVVLCCQGTDAVTLVALSEACREASITLIASIISPVDASESCLSLLVPWRLITHLFHPLEPKYVGKGRGCCSSLMSAEVSYGRYRTLPLLLESVISNK